MTGIRTAPAPSAADAALMARYGNRYQAALGRTPRTPPPPPGDSPPPTRGRPPGTTPAPDPIGTPTLGNPQTKPTLALRALSRLTYGLTPTALAEYRALGSTDAARYEAFVNRQLAWESIDDDAVETRLRSSGYVTLDKTLVQLWADHVLPNPEYNIRMRPAFEVQRAAMTRAVHSKRQLHELMVTFWHDHFNVQVSDFNAGPVYVHYDRNVMRTHALGNFRTMLEAMARSTAMMYYLDNRSNTKAGPNENFGRELLELHTMGTENYLGFLAPGQVPPCPEDPSYPIGYTDIDVYETAAAFTGWTVRDGSYPFQSENDGTFAYRAQNHDNGPKSVLGLFLLPDAGDMKDGRDIMDRLATHPRVAKFICKKLIRRFFEDAPPQALIDSAALVFRSNWQNPEQLRLVMRHILLSDYARTTVASKTRRPMEVLAGALRSLGSDWTIRLDDSRSNDVMYLMGFTGHLPYDWPAPNGYPDVSPAWSGSNSLAMTWRLLGWITSNRVGDGTTPYLAPILDATRAGVPSWTPRALVDFWCTRILGARPTAKHYRTLLAFMAQNGSIDGYVVTDTNDYAMTDLKRHYNRDRLLSMVSLILTSPENFSR